ncbi:hypothetical protein Slala03_82190 [Streptomyces lavendulae subsp. lavendulae]|nr:hypothetical protein Slala03_82190 [Streptomyces lavendulae subsp. lavendulae]
MVERERAAAGKTQTRDAGAAGAEGGVIKEFRVASTSLPTVVGKHRFHGSGDRGDRPPHNSDSHPDIIHTSATTMLLRACR